MSCYSNFSFDSWRAAHSHSYVPWNRNRQMSSSFHYHSDNLICFGLFCSNSSHFYSGRLTLNVDCLCLYCSTLSSKLRDQRGNRSSGVEFSLHRLSLRWVTGLSCSSSVLEMSPKMLLKWRAGWRKLFDLAAGSGRSNLSLERWVHFLSRAFPTKAALCDTHTEEMMGRGIWCPQLSGFALSSFFFQVFYVHHFPFLCVKRQRRAAEVSHRCFVHSLPLHLQHWLCQQHCMQSPDPTWAERTWTKS